MQDGQHAPKREDVASRCRAAQPAHSWPENTEDSAHYRSGRRSGGQPTSKNARWRFPRTRAPAAACRARGCQLYPATGGWNGGGSGHWRSSPLPAARGTSLDVRRLPPNERKNVTSRPHRDQSLRRCHQARAAGVTVAAAVQPQRPCGLRCRRGGADSSVAPTGKGFRWQTTAECSTRTQGRASSTFVVGRSTAK